MDPAPTQDPIIPMAQSASSNASSPTSAKSPTFPSASSPQQSSPVGEYRSNVYCSLECEMKEKGATSVTYKEIARSLSYDFSHPDPRYTLEGLITSGLPLSDPSNAYAPPSPLFVSGSDTESSNAGGPESGPACSAPNILDFHRFTRQGPDDAWNEVQLARSRRSSMNPALRPLSLARHQSNTSTTQGWGDVSSDSLSSLWNTTSSEQELSLARSTSNGPKARNVTFASAAEREALGAQRRSMSHTANRSAPMATGRPAIARSSLSHTSLTASPSRDANQSSAFGSTPDHTRDLFYSFNAAFPVRDGTGTSTSFKQKGFVFPTSASTPNESRRGSMTGAGLQRPGTGTIRARPKQTAEVTWDSVGRKEIDERRHRANSNEPPHHDHGSTPKQSLAKVDGQWKVVYGEEASTRARSHRSSSRGSEASRRSSESYFASEHQVPRATLGTSVSSTSHARTPVAAASMPPPTSIPVRGRRDGSLTPSSRAASAANMPDLATLRIGSAGCAPHLDKETVVHHGFDWSDHERKGGKTYALPPNFKVDRSKVGLFYFQH